MRASDVNKASPPLDPPKRESDSTVERVDHLFDEVYRELRLVAAQHMRKERAQHTLTPTSLVHEVYLRLIERSPDREMDRLTFMAAAAICMRRVLVDHARRRNALMREGRWRRVRLTTIEPLTPAAPAGCTDVLELNELLDVLRGRSTRCAHVAELRCFGGMSVTEIADYLNISRRTATFDWRYARAWLLSQLQQD